MGSYWTTSSEAWRRKWHSVDPYKVTERRNWGTSVCRIKCEFENQQKETEIVLQGPIRS